MTAYHLLRRAIDTVTTQSSEGDGNDDNPHVPIVGALIVYLTCVVFFLVLFAISYTVGHLIPTLCMIESPETAAYVPVNNIGADEPPAYSEDEDGAPRFIEIEESNLVRNKPFTSSVRATLAHLRARAGFWAGLRGLGLFMVLGLLRNILVGLISLGTGNVVMVAIASVIVEVFLANIHMAWIHIVISEPSPLRWWHRLPKPTFITWRRIAPAVAVWSVTTQLVFLLPMLVVRAGAHKYQSPYYHPGKKEIYLTMGQMFGAVLLTLVLFILLEIPAMVAMTRVAASMLPEEDETIVPFDRTYGGKTTPTILGGDGKIDLKEAWKSFPWASRKRLVILCAKVVGITLAVWVLFFFVVMAEALLLFESRAFGHLMKGIHKGLSS